MARACFGTEMDGTQQYILIQALFPSLHSPRTALSMTFAAMTSLAFLTLL